MSEQDKKELSKEELQRIEDKIWKAKICRRLSVIAVSCVFTFIMIFVFMLIFVDICGGGLYH